MRRLLRRLKDERGIALVMALGIMVVLGISVTATIDYATSNARHANSSNANQDSFSLAEAGINNSLAVLNKSTNNALDSDTLPPCTSNNVPTARSTWRHDTYGGGDVYWCGDLDRSTAVWTVTSVGSSKNPTGAQANNIERTLTAKIPITANISAPPNNPSWNYMEATHTGSQCDETLGNNVGGASRLYAMGNLCISNNANLTPSALVVLGNFHLDNNTSVGASTSMATRVETYVGGGCKYGQNNYSYITPCPGDSERVYAKKISSPGPPPTYVAGVNPNPIVITPPTLQLQQWYDNSIPGPTQPCTTVSPGPGSPITFDNNTTRDNSVASQNLTPTGSSYTCRVGPPPSTVTTTLSAAINATQTTITVASAATMPSFGQFRITVGGENMMVTAGAGSTTWTVTRGIDGTTAAAASSGATVSHTNPSSGELSWNGTTHVLTISGTIFIDGSITMGDGSTDQYNGQGTIYTSGTFTVNGKMCGGISGTNCDFTTWNPNTEMMTIVANGNSGGDSVILAIGGSWQGALFATNNILLNNNATSDGPMVASQITINNNVTTQAFGTVVNVPIGMPGNNDVYAQPNPAQLFSG